MFLVALDASGVADGGPIGQGLRPESNGADLRGAPCTRSWDLVSDIWSLFQLWKVTTRSCTVSMGHRP